MKEIAKDSEQAIFGDNDDNNGNNGDNDDKKRTFPPPNGDFVNEIMENRNKENKSNRNNDNNEKFFKLSKLNKEAKKNLNEPSNTIDKIREIKASKNSLNKIAKESKELLEKIKKYDENKKYTSADEVLKSANAKENNIKNTNEVLKEYYKNEVQRRLEKMERLNKIINDNSDMASEKSEIINRLIELYSLRIK